MTHRDDLMTAIAQFVRTHGYAPASIELNSVFYCYILLEAQRPDLTLHEGGWEFAGIPITQNLHQTQDYTFVGMVIS